MNLVIYEGPPVSNIKGVFLPDLFRHEDNPLTEEKNIPVFISIFQREQRYMIKLLSRT